MAHGRNPVAGASTGVRRIPRSWRPLAVRLSIDRDPAIATEHGTGRRRHLCCQIEFPFRGSEAPPQGGAFSWPRRASDRQTITSIIFARGLSLTDDSTGGFPSAFALNGPACARSMKPREVLVRPTKACAAVA